MANSSSSGDGKQPAAAASTREMGKNHNPVVVFWISPKCWWMIPIGVRDNHTYYSKRPRTASQVPNPVFSIKKKNNCQKHAKKAPFSAICVSSLSLEGAICIETNLDDEQTSLIMAVFNGKKKVPLHSFPKKLYGHSMCSTMVGGGWQLAVGRTWQLVAVGGGWQRLVVGDWWLVAVGSG